MDGKPQSKAYLAEVTFDWDVTKHTIVASYAIGKMISLNDTHIYKEPGYYSVGFKREEMTVKIACYEVWHFCSLERIVVNGVLLPTFLLLVQTRQVWLHC